MQVKIDLQDGMHFLAVGEDSVTVDLDSSTEHGGTGRGLRPMEMLLVGLGTCTAMDVISILRKKRQAVTSYRVEVQGQQRDTIPRVFTEVTIRHIVTGHDLSEDAVRRSIELSEQKYCPAHAMLRQAVPIRSDLTIREA